MMPNAIRTERLDLTPIPWVSRDYVAWLNDPEVVKYSEQRHKVHTIESVLEYVTEIGNSPNSYIWGIYHLSDSGKSSAFIGTITAHVDMQNGTADMGILIGNKIFWGSGIGREAWNAVANWLFENRDIRKIEAGCHYENRAMRKVAEHCGMILEGVRHDHFMVDGKPCHLLLYGKMKPVGVRVAINDVQSARC